jgi:hypothetical protein
MNIWYGFHQLTNLTPTCAIIRYVTSNTNNHAFVIVINDIVFSPSLVFQFSS